MHIFLGVASRADPTCTRKQLCLYITNRHIQPKTHELTCIFAEHPFCTTNHSINIAYALFSAPAAGSAGRVSLAQAPLALAPLLPAVLSLAASLSLDSRGARDLPVEVDHSPLPALAAAGAAADLAAAPAAEEEEDLGAAARSPLRRSALWLLLLLPEVSLVVGALAEELAAGAAVDAEAGTKGSDSADNFRICTWKGNRAKKWK